MFIYLIELFILMFTTEMVWLTIQNDSEVVVLHLNGNFSVLTEENKENVGYWSWWIISKEIWIDIYACKFPAHSAQIHKRIKFIMFIIWRGFNNFRLMINYQWYKRAHRMSDIILNKKRETTSFLIHFL